ncbi:hypothetical protein NX059_007695 [Plenodomus lindquistii]|nr:hypothetical protein NX059_007695 [Plenodomus lindquistii]
MVKGNRKGNRLIIGLDYGTTYTGLSFCESSSVANQAEPIEIVHDWPSIGVRNVTKEKVPSEVTYQDSGILWGSLIPADVSRHMWTKLQLDSKQGGEAAKITREIATSSQNSDKQPDDIITDYLTQVKAHLLTNLDHKYGKALWKTMPITLVVTVPAVWSDLAKSRTLAAVDNAGFNSLEFSSQITTVLTTEPEAAAIHTIRTLRGTTQDTNFAVGDGFIVCDMGGGTVDLIAYRVSGLNPTFIEEATVGNGEQCGGSSVDRAFLRWLEGRLGTADFKLIAGCRSEEVRYTSIWKPAATLLQNFIMQAKNNFSGTETYILQLPYPLSKIDLDEARGIIHGEIYLKPEDMEGMFQKATGCTYKLISEQVSRASKVKNIKMKYLFMVGGFSESPFIYTKIKDFAEDLGLITIRPNYAWSAVARGAAAKGLEVGNSDPESGIVRNRKCRRNYGNTCNSSFDPAIHSKHDAYICEYTGRKKATHQASWLLTKGQDLPTNTKAPHAMLSFQLIFWPYEDRTATVKFITSDEDDAPKHAYDASVSTVATLHVDLSKVPKKEFKAKKNLSGLRYDEVHVDLTVSIQSALEFGLQIKGKNYGVVAAKYE